MFSSNIQYIPGEGNCVADALSRVEELESYLNYEALATSQQEDEELKSYLESDSVLRLRLVPFLTLQSVFCDVISSAERPFITEYFHKAEFKSVHQLPHPGARLSNS